MVVQNRHGKVQPVAPGFLATEKAEDIEAFFAEFKKAHTLWERIDYFFVEKDYNESRAIERNFTGAKVLLCVFHVLAYPKKRWFDFLVLP